MRAVYLCLMFNIKQYKGVNVTFSFRDTKSFEQIRKEMRDKYQANLLTKQEVAMELRTSCSSIDRMRKAGLIKTKKIGGKVMVSVDEIVRIIEG